jgi:hypothetical protein
VKLEGRNPLSDIEGALKRIWALPNTIIGLAYGSVGMIFRAKPVWDSAQGAINIFVMLAQNNLRSPIYSRAVSTTVGEVHL